MNTELLHTLENRVFSVGEYVELINTIVAPLSVRVTGEVSGMRVSPQWVFFDLKDAEDGSVLRCGMHHSGYRRIGVPLEDGMRVAVEGAGKLTQKSGNFGFWVRDIVLTGEGALRRAYELLLAQLEKEGMFRQKRTLPLAVEHVALITSLSGVVIEDVRKNLAPHGIRVSVLHSSVEGASSAPEIVRALERAIALEPQVIMVVRGGGSLESLQAFNTEMVARALFASPVPTIVGVGHDVDVPIASMVGDVAVSTPTAAAHAINETWRVVAVRHERASAVMVRGEEGLLVKVGERMRTATLRIHRGVDRVRTLGDQYLARVAAWSRACVRMCCSQQETTDTIFLRVIERQHKTLRTMRERVLVCERVVMAHDPRRILSRGYAIPRMGNGRVAHSVHDVKKGDTLSLLVQDGTIETTVV